MRWLTALLMGLSLQLVPQALAQESEAPAPAAEEETTETEAETPPPEPAPGNDSPFQYEASEQISEDLSVSFPVDI